MKKEQKETVKIGCSEWFKDALIICLAPKSVKLPPENVKAQNPPTNVQLMYFVGLIFEVDQPM